MVDLALFDFHADSDESAHLLGCPDCRTELTALREVAELGSEAQDLRNLPPPPEHVWAAIAEGVAPPAGNAPDRAADPGSPGRRRSRRRARRAWLPPFLLVAASVVLAVAGTTAVLRLADRPAPPEVTARASLNPLPTAPSGASGRVEVLNRDELKIDVSDLPLTTGYYEVWLLNPDAPGKMQSLGSLPSGSKAQLPIPPGTDLNTYRLVDVSAEAHDGDSSHSGDSLLRGTLTQ